jgi:hypothetical protein
MNAIIVLITGFIPQIRVSDWLWALLSCIDCYNTRVYSVKPKKCVNHLSLCTPLNQSLLTSQKLKQKEKFYRISWSNNHDIIPPSSHLQPTP